MGLASVRQLTGARPRIVLGHRDEGYLKRLFLPSPEGKKQEARARRKPGVGRSGRAGQAALLLDPNGLPVIVPAAVAPCFRIQFHCTGVLAAHNGFWWPGYGR